MPTYEIAFAIKFAEIAGRVVADGLYDVESRRAVVYISRLSMELTLKAFLEKAGLSVSQIKKHWHNLGGLLAEVDKCEVKVQVSPGYHEWVPASRLRAIEVRFLDYCTTAGVILEAEDHGASIYPNEIRYGVVPRDFPPEALAEGASCIANWVLENWGTARKA